MSFSAYLHDHLRYGLFFGALLVLFSLTLWLDPHHPVSFATVIYADVLVLVASVPFLGVDYWLQNRWYRQLKARSEAGDGALEWRLPTPPNHAQALSAAAYNHALRAHQQTVTRLIAQQQDQKAFIDSWVHEIKVPLAAVVLMADTVADALPADTSEQLGLQLDKINFYVEQVLYYSRLDSFSQDYLLQEYDLRPIVNAVVADAKNSFIAKRLHFRLTGAPTTVLTDAKWLRFILTQLLSNAIKYTPAGGTITADCEDDAQEARLTIRDTGIGIPADEQHRVFEKGFTGTNGRHANQKSTGLGLYLAQQLSQKLGHHLTLTATVGQGTQVTVHFPHLNYYGETGATLRKPPVREA